MNKEKRVSQFGSTIITLLIIYLLIKFGIPLASRKITGMDFPLPVPGTLMVFYMTLILIATFIYITSSEEKLQAFLLPIQKMLKGEYGSNTRLITLIIIPIIAGISVYSSTVPKITSPTSLRIQHPSSNFPKQFEAAKNPIENPTDTDIDKFIEQVKNNSVEFIPQAKMPPGGIDFIPLQPVQTFLKELKEAGQGFSPALKEKARLALREKNLFEGRILYEMNCRPCHGDSVAGDGPMADGFKLRPINFTDNGTIETIVEGYTFWRVSTGGRGLPKEATPWDSAMPVWQLDLTEDQRWKIIMAEYDLAQKTV
ncbi:MAG: cytochrome c [Nitrospinae bacterium]|nr:cytochrome c [Nitrospinota bacterium]